MKKTKEKFSNRQRRKKRKYDCDEDEGDDFPSMFTDLFRGVNWKVSMFLFIMMVFIFSDIYIELFLNSVSGAVEGDTPTTKGTTLQIVTTILMYIVLDLLVKGEIL